MHKILNLIMFCIVFFFILIIINYYSSSKNINTKNFNRKNIDQILKGKINDLPTLINDTDDVIIFNNSLEIEIKEDKKRSFWNLLNR